jgi:hypothetical protein
MSTNAVCLLIIFVALPQRWRWLGGLLSAEQNARISGKYTKQKQCRDDVERRHIDMNGGSPLDVISDSLEKAASLRASYSVGITVQEEGSGKTAGCISRRDALL